MKNISIANDFSSNSWILASDLIIQNNCTTALEAYLLGVKPIQLNFFKIQLWNMKYQKMISKFFKIIKN